MNRPLTEKAITIRAMEKDLKNLPLIHNRAGNHQPNPKVKHYRKTPTGNLRQAAGIFG
jgi:hypothetical protein